jgi:hypothetical protein
MVYFKTNLAESSKERNGSKSAVLPMIMMMMKVVMMIRMMIPENCYPSSGF